MDAVFLNTGYIQFVLDEQVTVAGDSEWNTLDENILQRATSDDLGGSKGTTINVVVRAEGAQWEMVAHHASPVSGAS